MPHGTKEDIKRWKAARRERRMGQSCGGAKNSLKGRSYKKWSFPNYLIALQAAKRLSSIGDRRSANHPNPIYIYQCDCCGGIHIGHLATGESVLMYEGISVNVREAQGIECPPSAS